MKAETEYLSLQRSNLDSRGYISLLFQTIWYGKSLLLWVSLEEGQPRFSKVRRIIVYIERLKVSYIL